MVVTRLLGADDDVLTKLTEYYLGLLYFGKLRKVHEEPQMSEAR